MKKLLLIILILAFFSALVDAQSITDTDGADLRERLKSQEFQIGVLVQTLGTFSFEDDNFLGGRRYQLGTIRLDFKGQLKSNFTYRAQFDLTKSPSILDAQVGYKFSDNFEVIAGSVKPTISAALDPHPAKTDFVHRARVVSTLMNTREVGLTALGSAGKFNYRLGMYNGYGLQSANDNRFMYTARLGYTEEFSAGELEIGLNGSLNNSREEAVGNTGFVSSEGRLLYGAFARYESNSWFGTVEFMQSQFERYDVTFDETITAYYATIGYKITAYDELLARFDQISYDLLERDSQRITVGWNRQMSDLISFKLNVIGDFNEVSDQFGAAARLQFFF